MASGLSKTKWNGNTLLHDEDSNGPALDVTLAYKGKKPEEAILKVEPATLYLIWQGASPDNRLYYGDNADGPPVTDPDLDIVYWSVEVQSFSSQ